MIFETKLTYKVDSISFIYHRGEGQIHGELGCVIEMFYKSMKLDDKLG